jgi:hypothetical protein
MDKDYKRFFHNITNYSTNVNLLEIPNNRLDKIPVFIDELGDLAAKMSLYCYLTATTIKASSRHV